MAIRPPRRPITVSRILSERAQSERVHAQRDHASPPRGTDPEIFGLGGITGMIGALREMVEQLAAGAKSSGDDAAEGTHSRNFTLGGQNARAVFGYTLRMGPDGVSAERFGDIPPKDSDDTPAPQQPITEVYQDGDTIVVIAELPGADPERITCHPTGNCLRIEATGPRAYRKNLTLPTAVTMKGMAQSLCNGILEVRLKRAGAA